MGSTKVTVTKVTFTWIQFVQIFAVPPKLTILISVDSKEEQVRLLIQRIPFFRTGSSPLDPSNVPSSRQTKAKDLDWMGQAENCEDQPSILIGTTSSRKDCLQEVAPQGDLARDRVTSYSGKRHVRRGKRICKNMKPNATTLWCMNFQQKRWKNSSLKEPQILKLQLVQCIACRI